MSSEISNTAKKLSRKATKSLKKRKRLSKQLRGEIKCIDCAYEDLKECQPNTKSCNGAIYPVDLMLRSRIRQWANKNNAKRDIVSENDKLSTEREQDQGRG